MSQSTGAADDQQEPRSSREVLFSQIRTQLESDFRQVQEELQTAQTELSGLLRETGGTEATDEADVGTRLSSLEQEACSGRNAEALLQQTALALARIETGDYGSCQTCGNPIGLARLEAFPRATMCLPCRRRAEEQR